MLRLYVNGSKPKSKSVISHAADFLPIADIFGLFLILSVLLRRGVEVELTREQWPYRPACDKGRENNLGGHLSSDLKSVTLITPISMCTLSPTASEAMAASK